MPAEDEHEAATLGEFGDRGLDRSFEVTLRKRIGRRGHRRAKRAGDALGEPRNDALVTEVLPRAIVRGAEQIRRRERHTLRIAQLPYAQKHVLRQLLGRLTRVDYRVDEAAE